MSTFSISKSEFDYVIDNRKYILVDYELNEIILQEYVQNNLPNIRFDVVSKKIAYLNSFYSTRIPVQEMTQHILTRQDFDKKLKNGDINLVGEIAQMGTSTNKKDYFSFATKFCAMTNPQKFPIFDKLVWMFFAELEKNGFFNGTKIDDKIIRKFKPGTPNRSKNYSEYIEIYDAFMKISGIYQYEKNYRKVDYYIWGLIQIGIKLQPISESNRNLYFLKNILAGIVGSAAWDIIKAVIRQL